MVPLLVLLGQLCSVQSVEDKAGGTPGSQLVSLLSRSFKQLIQLIVVYVFYFSCLFLKFQRSCRILRSLIAGLPPFVQWLEDAQKAFYPLGAMIAGLFWQWSLCKSAARLRKFGAWSATAEDFPPKLESSHILGGLCRQQLAGWRLSLQSMFRFVGCRWILESLDSLAMIMECDSQCVGVRLMLCLKIRLAGQHSTLTSLDCNILNWLTS